MRESKGVGADGAVPTWKKTHQTMCLDTIEIYVYPSFIRGNDDAVSKTSFSESADGHGYCIEYAHAGIGCL